MKIYNVDLKLIILFLTTGFVSDFYGKEGEARAFFQRVMGGLYHSKDDDSFRCKKHRECILKLLRNSSENFLGGTKIVLSGEMPPNYDVPSMGAGDMLLYPRVLRDKLKEMGAEEVALDLGKRYEWLTQFFVKCSDLPLFSRMSEKEKCGYIQLEIRSVLDNLKELSAFKPKSRYLSDDCKKSGWAIGEVEKVKQRIKDISSKENDDTGCCMIPVLFTRQSAFYDLEDRNEEELFGYLNKRSISREELEKLLQEAHLERYKKENIRIYNIQLEDQDKEEIPGIEKPGNLYSGYEKRNGAFVNDAIMMKAVIESGGKIVSIDSSALNLAMGIPSSKDKRINIIALLRKDYNSRWKTPFLKEDSSVCWSPNVRFIIKDGNYKWSEIWMIVD